MGILPAGNFIYASSLTRCPDSSEQIT